MENYKIIRTTVATVSKDLEKQLLRLTLPYGDMKMVYNRCKLTPNYVGSVIVFYVNKKVVGWGLRWKIIGCHQRQWRLFLYVDPKFRRQGIARKIVHYARSDSRLRQGTIISGTPWDPVSNKFWDSLGKDKPVNHKTKA